MEWPPQLLMWGWRIGVPILVTVFAAATAVDAGPAYRARFGDGTRGTFTSVREDCGRTCSWYGDFVSDDVAITRSDVRFVGDDVSYVGEQVPAQHTGGTNVYAVDGGWDWLLLTAFAIGSLILGAAWVWSLPLFARWTGARRDRWPRRTWYGEEARELSQR